MGKRSEILKAFSRKQSQRDDRIPSGIEANRKSRATISVCDSRPDPRRGTPPEFKGFHGDYELEIDTGAQTVQRAVHLSRGGNRFSVTV